MSDVNLIRIRKLLPNGADIHTNINIYCLKSLYHFIWQLSCIHKHNECDGCKWNGDCDYYKCTGENFKYYPGILVENDIFTKSHYLKNEEVVIQLYLIGNNLKWSNYIPLFLNQLDIKSTYDLSIQEIDGNKKEISGMKIYSIIESKSVINSYNQMIRYYNSHYGTAFDLMKEVDTEIRLVKHSSIDHLKFKNKRINPQGYLYHVDFIQPVIIDQSIEKIGIGKFNYLGGGRYEN